MTDIDSVTQKDLIDFGVRVRESAPEADSLLVSCGGFRTLEIIAPLEARTGVPVISSMPHGLWAGARLVGFEWRGAGLRPVAVEPEGQQHIARRAAQARIARVDVTTCRRRPRRRRHPASRPVPGTTVHRRIAALRVDIPELAAVGRPRTRGCGHPSIPKTPRREWRSPHRAAPDCSHRAAACRACSGANQTFDPVSTSSAVRPPPFTGSKVRIAHLQRAQDRPPCAPHRRPPRRPCCRRWPCPTGCRRCAADADPCLPQRPAAIRRVECMDDAGLLAGHENAPVRSARARASPMRRSRGPVRNPRCRRARTGR